MQRKIINTFYVSDGNGSDKPRRLTAVEVVETPRVGEILDLQRAEPRSVAADQMRLSGHYKRMPRWWRVYQVVRKMNLDVAAPHQWDDAADVYLMALVDDRVVVGGE